MTTKTLCSLVLAAAVGAPWTLALPASAATRVEKTQSEKATFSCRGIGVGHHKKGMTEEECRKLGGTVVPLSNEKKSSVKIEEKWSCKGVGSGHHKKGMTKEDCVKMGGTVEKGR